MPMDPPGTDPRDWGRRETSGPPLRWSTSQTNVSEGCWGPHDGGRVPGWASVRRVSGGFRWSRSPRPPLDTPTSTSVTGRRSSLRRPWGRPRLRNGPGCRAPAPPCAAGSPGSALGPASRGRWASSRRSDSLSRSRAPPGPGLCLCRAHSPRPSPAPFPTHCRASSGDCPAPGRTRPDSDSLSHNRPPTPPRRPLDPAPRPTHYRAHAHPVRPAPAPAPDSLSRPRGRPATGVLRPPRLGLLLPRPPRPGSRLTVEHSHAPPRPHPGPAPAPDSLSKTPQGRPSRSRSSLYGAERRNPRLGLRSDTPSVPPTQAQSLVDPKDRRSKGRGTRAERGRGPLDVTSGTAPCGELVKEPGERRDRRRGRGGA